GCQNRPRHATAPVTARRFAWTAVPRRGCLAHTELRRSRVLVAAAGLLLGLGCLWIRVAWLQIGRHAFYAERAERNQEQRVLIRATRGELRDRHGRPPARDLPTYSISAAPHETTDAPAVALQLAPVLD